MARAATLEEYIAALPEPVRDVAAAARGVVDERLPDATSAIKWAHPTWSVGHEPVCYLKAAARHVTFGFWRGACIDDPSGRLETSGEVMAHVKLRSVGDIDAELFGEWLRQARALVDTRRPGDAQAAPMRCGKAWMRSNAPVPSSRKLSQTQQRKPPRT